MSELYQKEREQYGLRESCEDCRHFCEDRKKCAVMYPVQPHLKENFTSAKIGERIYFCKMFEAK